LLNGRGHEALGHPVLALGGFTACGDVPPIRDPDAAPPPPPPSPGSALGAGAGTLTSPTYTLDVFLGAPVASQSASGGQHTLTPATPIEP
jgi:hypothetical protein